MRWSQSRIRAEAAALYADKHTEVSMADLGIALGMGKPEVQRALAKHGVKRPRGQAAKAYVQPAVAGNQRYDHAAILKDVRAHPELRYREIGAMHGCGWGIPAYVAQKNGIFRGFRRTKAAE